MASRLSGIKRFSLLLVLVDETVAGVEQRAADEENEDEDDEGEKQREQLLIVGTPRQAEVRLRVALTILRSGSKRARLTTQLVAAAEEPLALDHAPVARDRNKHIARSGSHFSEESYTKEEELSTDSEL